MDIKNLAKQNMLILGMAGTGFVLSFLISLINFSGIGVLIYKPLVIALIWGVIGVVIKTVLKKFIPEMHDVIFSEGGSADLESEISKGNNLDVTVGEDSSLDAGGGMDDISFGSLDGGDESMDAPSGDITKLESADYDTGDIEFDQDPKEMAKAVRTIIKRDEST